MGKQLRINAPKQVGNKFCGPSVVSALTGCETREAAQLIRIRNGARQVRGSSTGEIRYALQHFGVNMQERFLFRDARVRDAMKLPGFYIAAITTADGTGHWVAFGEGKYTCGMVGKVLKAGDERIPESAKLAELHECWGEVVKPKALAEAKTERATRETVKRKAKRIAAEIGCQIDDEYDPRDGSGMVWVYPPEGLFPDGNDDEADPYNGAHAQGDWEEALDAVMEYQKLVEAKGGAA